MTNDARPDTEPPSTAQLRERFAVLHRSDGFVMPNAWDRGTVRLFARLGYPAVATTSAGFGRSIGKDDQEVTRDELLAHVEDLAGLATVPVNVDSERLFPDDPGGITAMVDDLAAAGASGCSIEDYDPGTGAIVGIEAAVAAVAEAVEACERHGITLTARAENHLYGIDDLHDTIERLSRYRDAGAGCLYAPGPTDPDVLRRLVEATAAPLNVLAMPAAPPAAELFALGARRISTGSRTHSVAMAAVEADLASL